jgi:hypothetical protein
VRPCRQAGMCSCSLLSPQSAQLLIVQRGALGCRWAPQAEARWRSLAAMGARAWQRTSLAHVVAGIAFEPAGLAASNGSSAPTIAGLGRFVARTLADSRFEAAIHSQWDSAVMPGRSWAPVGAACTCWRAIMGHQRHMSTTASVPATAATQPPAGPRPDTLAQLLADRRPLLAPLQPPTQQRKTPASYIPWVFSRHQTPIRHVANRMGFLMQALEEEQVRVACRPSQALIQTGCIYSAAAGGCAISC